MMTTAICFQIACLSIAMFSFFYAINTVIFLMLCFPYLENLVGCEKADRDEGNPYASPTWRK